MKKSYDILFVQTVEQIEFNSIMTLQKEIRYVLYFFLANP